MAVKEPAVKRKTLARTAGIVWIAAGLVLSIRSIAWFSSGEINPYILVGAALLIGILKGRFLFSKIVVKNISRIKELAPHKDKVCIFAFQAIQSYLLVTFMIALGVALRMSPIPRDILAVIYLAIGTALFISGLKYISESKDL